ncbi:MAG: hypothetical protein KAS72_15160, partial [Phycisphaerales bacterium]|nr:hypothetical protein [Phycisphaerales bacterium]
GRRIATALTKLDRDNQRAWIESWLPLVLAMPVVGMAAAATQMGDASLAVRAFPGLGVPTVSGMIALGLLLCCGRGTSVAEPAIRPWHAVLWAFVGLMMLLFAAVDRIEIWQGQCLMTASLVLIWHGLPPAARSGLRLADASQTAGLDGRLLLGVLSLGILAAGLGYVGCRSIGADATTAGGVIQLAVLWLIAALGGAAVVTAVGRRLGIASAGAVVACWAALACWLSLGVWTFRSAVSRIDLAAYGDQGWLSSLAGELTFNARVWLPLNGLGQASFEAVGLVIAPGIWLICGRSRVGRRRLGVLCVVAGVAALLARAGAELAW